jgi:ferritin-like metal-binding protein YciE
MAKALGETAAVPLLEENLEQERAALTKLEKAADRLSREYATA